MNAGTSGSVIPTGQAYRQRGRRTFIQLWLRIREETSGKQHGLF